MRTQFIFERRRSVANRDRIQPMRAEQRDQCRPVDTAGLRYRRQMAKVEQREVIFEIIGGSTSDLRQSR